MYCKGFLLLAVITDRQLAATDDKDRALRVISTLSVMCRVSRIQAALGLLELTSSRY